MASIIRSTLRGVTRPNISSSYAPPSASFASSSRHGLDFTRPLLANNGPLPSKGTLTIEEQVTEEGFAAEPESKADASVGSHTTPSTSNSAPEVVPTPQPRLSINTPPTPTSSPVAGARSSTPQFSSPTSNSASTTTTSRTPLTTTAAPAPAPSKGKKGSNGPGIRWAIESNHIGAGDRTVLPTHTLHVKSTRNNIILSLTDGLGPIFSTVSGGTDRTFKNSQRSSYEAATQASTKMFDKIIEWSRDLPKTQEYRPKIRIAFNGLFGMGREAFAGALAGPEGQEMRTLVTRVEDRTRIKIGGARAPKPRRL
ncbi:hypothetical protein I316_00322 [Kwoniella heveanensis BCC8398]|uniref:Uncharacterized protein n=1 Tax=Kwoniella heveanensis BCC8398 TaxID=1296120 RepID=A0A1B9H4B3_9TREE|nr:hypothetical protein I316_00322 [Kwoniella heveanensis BCC8398]